MNNIILITQDKEKVSTDKVRDGNYQTNNIEDIPKAHIPIII